MHAPDENSPSLPSCQWGMASLRAESAPQALWLWQGYLATGAVTLLTSQWKTGKTTLISVLLSRMKTGGLLAGLSVSKGRAVVVSEESATQWLLRGRRLDLEDHVGWFCRPFPGRPRPEQWQTLLERIAAIAAERRVSLVVVDPLAAFYPGKSENDASAMLDALAPLQRLAERGLSVVALHHPAKKEHGDGPSGRGSGALLGCADILIEMRWYSRAVESDRRRRLLALSRFDDTPRQLVVELNDEGTDYLAHGSFADEEFVSQWQLVENLLRFAPCKFTRAEILSHWPSPQRPDAATLYRWLRRAVEMGLLRQDGLGQQRHPFRYWLPESEERWRKDPLALIRMPELFAPPSGKRR